MSAKIVVVIVGPATGIWTPPAGFNISNYLIEGIGGGQPGMTPDVSQTYPGGPVAAGGLGGMSGWYCASGTLYGAAPLTIGASYTYSVPGWTSAVSGSPWDTTSTWWNSPAPSTSFLAPSGSPILLVPGGWMAGAVALGPAPYVTLTGPATQPAAGGRISPGLDPFTTSYFDGMAGGFGQYFYTVGSNAGGGGGGGATGAAPSGYNYGGAGYDSTAVPPAAPAYGGGGGAGYGLNAGSETTDQRAGGLLNVYDAGATVSLGGQGGAGGHGATMYGLPGSPGTGWTDTTSAAVAGPGGGGGGGNADNTTGYAGGDGGLYGGGGGGGGYSQSGSAGAGGRGAPGVLVLTSYGTGYSYTKIIRGHS